MTARLHTSIGIYLTMKITRTIRVNSPWGDKNNVGSVSVWFDSDDGKFHTDHEIQNLDGIAANATTKIANFLNLITRADRDALAAELCELKDAVPLNMATMERFK